MKSSNSIDALLNPKSNILFILDIDSTLVTTYQRNQKILTDWIKLKQTEYPEDCLALKKAQCQFGDYGLRDALLRISFREKNSGSKNSLDQFWKLHFFSNKYLNADIATRGAINWTQGLEESGVSFVYLTARHKNTMWEGTLSSLDGLGFPISEETLFLKENLSESDEEYKSNQLSRIINNYPGKEIWFIDNEPVVLQRISKDHPNVNLIWFESTHSGNELPPKGALVIQHFNFSDTQS